MKLLKTLLMALLFAGGTYTFSQQNLPIGSPEALHAYLESNLDHISVEVNYADSPYDQEWTRFKIPTSHDPGKTREETIAKVTAMLKESLDAILTEIDSPETKVFYSRYAGNMFFHSIYANKNRKVPFKLIKDANGKWVVPPERYIVSDWNVPSHLYLIPFYFTNVSHGRIALQNNNGELEQVYDTVLDEDKWGAEQGIRIFNQISLDRHIFLIRYDLAISGKPGLLTLTSQDAHGRDKITLVNFQNGAVLKPLQVSKAGSGNDSVFITVAGNPEKSQVVEVSDSLSPPAWRLLDFVDKTTYGQRLIPYQEQGEHAFYRIRWVSDLEAASLKQQALAKENGN